MKRHAFTLIELLTVVAVLGILFTLVGVSYPGVQGEARRVICASNQKSLYTLIRLTRERLAKGGEDVLQYTDFLHTVQWPDRVYEEGQQKPTLFICPEETVVARPEIPNVVYRSGMNKSVYIPFDPNHFLCVSRQGVDENGDAYTEYCAEENPGVEAKWEYAMGVKQYSTNDGIWRVYNEGQEGQRRLVLTHCTCWDWDNHLYVDSEFYARNLPNLKGMTIVFNDFPTSYGYNTQLQGRMGVAGDTIVLLDYSKKVLADPFDLDMNEYLEGSGRHRGRHNVLFASGAVELRDTLELYPELDGSSWTPQADVSGRSIFESPVDEGDNPDEGRDLDDL